MEVTIHPFTEFEIVALAHNLLKVVRFSLTTFQQKQKNQKSWTENITFFRPTCYLGFFAQPLTIPDASIFLGRAILANSNPLYFTATTRATMRSVP